MGTNMWCKVSIERNRLTKGFTQWYENTQKSRELLPVFAFSFSFNFWSFFSFFLFIYFGYNNLYIHTYILTYIHTYSFFSHFCFCFLFSSLFINLFLSFISLERKTYDLFTGITYNVYYFPLFSAHQQFTQYSARTKKEIIIQSQSSQLGEKLVKTIHWSQESLSKSHVFIKHKIHSSICMSK